MSILTYNIMVHGRLLPSVPRRFIYVIRKEREKEKKNKKKSWDTTVRGRAGGELSKYNTRRRINLYLYAPIRIIPDENMF